MVSRRFISTGTYSTTSSFKNFRNYWCYSRKKLPRSRHLYAEICQISQICNKTQLVCGLFLEAINDLLALKHSYRTSHVPDVCICRKIPELLHYKPKLKTSICSIKDIKFHINNRHTSDVQVYLPQLFWNLPPCVLFL